MIKREEALNNVNSFIEDFAKYTQEDVEDLVNMLYDGFEQHIKSLEAQLTNTEQLTCDGCINKPNIGDNYDDICGYCSRFYSDHYTYIEGCLQ